MHNMPLPPNRSGPLLPMIKEPASQLAGEASGYRIGRIGVEDSSVWGLGLRLLVLGKIWGRDLHVELFQISLAAAVLGIARS